MASGAQEPAKASVFVAPGSDLRQVVRDEVKSTEAFAGLGVTVAKLIPAEKGLTIVVNLVPKVDHQENELESDEVAFNSSLKLASLNLAQEVLPVVQSIAHEAMMKSGFGRSNGTAIDLDLRPSIDHLRNCYSSLGAAGDNGEKLELAGSQPAGLESDRPPMSISAIVQQVVTHMTESALRRAGFTLDSISIPISPTKRRKRRKKKRILKRPGGHGVSDSEETSTVPTGIAVGVSRRRSRSPDGSTRKPAVPRFATSKSPNKSTPSGRKPRTDHNSEFITSYSGRDGERGTTPPWRVGPLSPQPSVLDLPCITTASIPLQDRDKLSDRQLFEAIRRARGCDHD